MSIPQPEAASGPPARRPHPQLDQMKRTWYFFRRNTLALVGLAIILVIAGVAVYAATQPISWTKVPAWCSTDYGPLTKQLSGYPNNFTEDCPKSAPIICTYEIAPPPNNASFCGGVWYPLIYKGSTDFPTVIAPTLSLHPMNGGPMPLGSLSISTSARTPTYDIYSSLLRGSDWSIMFSVAIVGAGALMGLVIGAISGFYGGWLDEVLMRLVDIFLSIPTILFVIVVVSVISQHVPTSGSDAYVLKLVAMILGFALVWWPFYARIVRGQVLTVREQKYVEAARAAGAPRRRILVKHIIPNSVYPVMIQFSLDVGTVPLLVGALVFLGFGTLLFPTVPFPEWGAISAYSVTDLQAGFLPTCWTPGLGCVIPWWQVFFPGVALFMFAISVNLLSDGLRDAWDPRLRR